MSDSNEPLLAAARTLLEANGEWFESAETGLRSLLNARYARRMNAAYERENFARAIDGAKSVPENEGADGDGNGGV